MSDAPSPTPDLNKAACLKLTTDIVCSYLAQNRMTIQEMPEFIRQVHATLESISGQKPEPEKQPTPAVDPRKSVHDDYIICLEDGVKLKSLRRHIRARYNLTPEQYRQKWGLPKDYPMVCRSYSKTRSEMAKQIGLGRPREAVKSEPVSEPAAG